MLNKLALGTVQFGIPYGINNSKGVVGSEELKAIFDLANKEGINVLDTAPSYGDAEERIGNLSNGKFKIISKFSAIPDGAEFSFKWLRNEVNRSIGRLKISFLDGLLLHKPMQLMGRKGRELYEGLELLKEEGLVLKIGISIYDPSELDLLKAYDFDIVQAPFNIFDRRLIDTGWLNYFAGSGKELHVRSIFLQGLLLMPPASRPLKFDVWKSLWKKYDQWLTESGLTALQATVRYALSFPEITKVIVGIDGLNHIEKIIQAAKGPLPPVPKDLFSTDIKLLNPLSWLEF